MLVGEHTGAASAYVGMTRGRERNVAHLVAESVDDARKQWFDVFGRDRADLGPAHARAARRRGDRPVRADGTKAAASAASSGRVRFPACGIALGTGHRVLKRG